MEINLISIMCYYIKVVMNDKVSMLFYLAINIWYILAVYTNENLKMG